MKKALLILFLLFVCGRVYGQSAATEESVKAAYIYHFINFVEWDDHLNNYYVCVPDDSELKDALEESLRGKMVNNRKIIVSRYASVCHILVTNHPEGIENTFTIGSIQDGALFEFLIVDNKLKFAANLDKIKNSKLKISSQLLKLALPKNS